MTQPLIEIGDQIDLQAQQIIGDGLAAFNKHATGYHDRRPLTVLIKDPHTGQTLGGITGRSAFGMAFLDLFHLPETLRGSGLGSRLLQAFEDEARRRGCRSAVLYTISFQAPGFYEKRGWMRFGEIPCEPQGSSRVFLSKAL
ncbi:GNAT family N-acetyltransferase [Pseudomonas sp. PDM05]|jgi:GNAT superfamily N-acetyltransferase|uniref:GNAT family N-acetyltransferase n=1 Tax=Pseudomonas sp. PDM05 TaxID=2769301 RepID=UPI001786639D|nr:GNAT family N-acetyltransferase [Pseudomonas sp. PDM05]MBD9460885.1 GNAT family N-acetyltransferase [Pseudomonas sp. PDM05]